MKSDEKKRSILDDAIAFAVEKHAGTPRKGTKIPYIVHPIEAMYIAATITDDQDILMAAVLHDTVEDAKIPVEEIRQQFGDRVAGLVSAESENKREGKAESETWEIRKQETIEELHNTTDLGVKIVALADKLSNMRAIARDYEEMGDLLWERFNQKDKKKHEWYYRSIANELAELNGKAAWKEYDALIRKVFG